MTASSRLRSLEYLQPPPARAAGIAAQCHAQHAMWPKAIEEMEAVVELNPRQANPWLGFMLTRGGQVQRAREVQDSLLTAWRRGAGGAYGLAVVHAGLRDCCERRTTQGLWTIHAIGRPRASVPTTSRVPSGRTSLTALAAAHCAWPVGN